MQQRELNEALKATASPCYDADNLAPVSVTEAEQVIKRAPAPRRDPWWKRAGWLVPVLLVLSKLKTIIMIVPKIKWLSSLLTAVVSVGAYSLFWGWPFAVGFVALLFLHELGHVIALRREGIQASVPMFIPFLGAVISAKSMGDDALAEARVGLAGPVFGAAATLVPLGLWLGTGDQFWQALAYVGFLINLFNLLPVTPLDGGRAMAAVSPYLWLVGLVCLVPVFFFMPSPILILVAVVGSIEAFMRLREHRRAKRAGAESQLSYYRTTPLQKLAVLVVYIGLAAALAIGLEQTFIDPETLR